MNDLPQNERFSAYLDGELTAAERAEMERLLASDPAARQLLDELKSLSHAIQSLPRETLGEDLSQRVLQTAERRMLTEGGPGDEASAPTPQERSVFRRLIDRRTMVWLSLTTAIAIVIVINDHWQGAGPMREIARQAADAPPAAEKAAARKPGPPPTIQAAPESESSFKAERLEAKKASAKRESKPAGAPVSDAVPAAPSAAKAKTPSEELHRMARKGDVGFGGRGEAAPMAAKAVPAPHKDGDVLGKVGYAGVSQKAAPVAENVLVVNCNIRPEAVSDRALEKLLTANRITWRENAKQRVELAESAESSAREREKPSDDKEMADRLAGERSGPTKLVYEVEASPAQVQATLAGLAAQPNVFLSLSVAPQDTSRPLNEAYQRAVANSVGQRGQAANAEGGMAGATNDKRFQFNQNVRVSGPELNVGPSGQLDVKVTEVAGDHADVGEEKSQVKDLALKQSQPQQAVTSTLMQQQEQLPLFSTTRQRVRFVLNVVDGSPVASQATAKPVAEAGKPAAEPASSSPAATPAKANGK